MATSPWMWREGTNPYRRTAFQVLGLSVDTRGKAAIRARIKTRRKQIESVPERFPLFGEVLAEADVSDAASAIEDPEARLYAELCTHRPRRTNVGDVAARLRDLPRPELEPVVDLPNDRLLQAVPALPKRKFRPILE